MEEALLDEVAIMCCVVPRLTAGPAPSDVTFFAGSFSIRLYREMVSYRFSCSRELAGETSPSPRPPVAITVGLTDNDTGSCFDSPCFPKALVIKADYADSPDLSMGY